MAHRVLAETAVSISEHKKNPMATLAAGEGMAVAVLNRNEPAFYCVPARAYEELMDLVDDLELGRIADARLTDGQGIKLRTAGFRLVVEVRVTPGAGPFRGGGSEVA
jgi:antitoxin StbD